MSINLIDYIIKKTGMSLKDLADKLNVSREQISKWKSGESILHKRDVLMKLAGLFGDDPDWAILVKTEKNSQAWIEYISYMSDYFQSASLFGDPEFYAPVIILGLAELGVSIPQNAPSIKTKSQGEYEYTKFDSLIDEYMQYYQLLIEWCEKYLSSDHDKIIDYELDLSHRASDLVICRMDEKLLISNGVEPSQLDLYKEKTEHEAKMRIRSMCEIMNKENIPLATDYFDLINADICTLEDDELSSTFVIIKPRIENYFSYVDRILLDEIRKTNSLLEALHVKTDKLLANDE